LTLLSSDEQERYKGFGLESRKREFLWSLVFVRRLLAFYTGKEIGTLKWGTREKGKPFLEDSTIQFSLSHTEGLIACSVGRRTVGVDVEKIEDGPLAGKRSQLLAGRFFSPAEQAFLQSLSLESQGLAFLRLFTMKEAYVKALGHGISTSFDDFTVPLGNHEISKRGSWEWFTRLAGNFWVSHVLENPGNGPFKYQIVHWDEKSLIQAEKNCSFKWDELCA
jgi:phosphopantetheinyl transferase